jgi:hypothetical protein
MSTAKFSREDLLCPLSQVRISFEGREERQVPDTTAGLFHPATDKLQGRPKLGRLVRNLFRRG